MGGHNGRGALMVCGTASGSGKSFLVTALCRLLARRGVAVAPFKAQNMSNQSAVADDGAEIARAQWAQARAAGVPSEAAMNPVLLKPTGERASQLVVMGRVAGVVDAADFGRRDETLLPVVLDALADLRRRYDVVVVEGAGSPAEVNLLDRDLANLPLAAAAGIPAVLVGDIDRGGVFAALVGTCAVLPPDLRRHLRAFVVNRFRGDARVLTGGPERVVEATGMAHLGVLPWLPGRTVDEEDSLDLTGVLSAPGEPGGIDVAVVRFPRIANATDVEPLASEPSVAVRLVDGPGTLGSPDLVILPGTKATVEDLAWLRRSGLADAVAACGAHVLGICGGYQMMGRTIVDDVESRSGRVAGLGWLDAETVFEPDKTVRRRRGRAFGVPVEGYEIRHGQPSGGGGWVQLADEHGNGPEGAASSGGRVRGTSLHGLFEHDAFRRAFLGALAAERGRTFTAGRDSFADLRRARADAAADLVERHLDVDALLALVAEGAPVPA